MLPAYAPDERQALLLHAALDPAPAAATAWSAAYDALGRDLSQADHDARALLPLVYSNLSAHGVEHEAVPQLRMLHRVSAFRNERLLGMAARVLSELAAADIVALPFKGIAMCARYYERPGDRPMADLDILVRPADAIEAAEVLERTGWVAKAPLDPRLRHALNYRKPPDATLDLHWRPLHEPVHSDGFWDAADGGALHPSDQLLVTCAHATYKDSRKGRWVADVAMIVRASGDRLDWRRLVERAEELHATLAVERVLRLARDEFAVPVPGDTLGALARAERPVFERVAHSVRARRPRRGQIIAVQWADYRRLRRISPAAAGGFPRYLCDVSGAASWRDLARLYARLGRNELSA